MLRVDDVVEVGGVASAGLAEATARRVVESEQAREGAVLRLAGVRRWRVGREACRLFEAAAGRAGAPGRVELVESFRISHGRIMPCTVGW